MKSIKSEAIIVAAGKGKRFKSKTAKPFVLLKNKPLLFYSLKTFQSHPEIKKIILVVEKSRIKTARALVRKYNIGKVKKIVSGGEKRKDSVLQGLRALDADTKLILIHDAARPLVKASLITRILAALKKYQAAVPAYAARDTLKRADSRWIVRRTLKREGLYHIQTPQGIRRELLPLMFKRSKQLKIIYDDSMLVEKNTPVKLIASDPLNLKITTPQDLILAKSILSL